MRSARVFALAITVFVAGGVHTSEAAGFSYKAGVGYDFISQEYFLDSIVRDSADAILTQWSLRTDYLDDVKGLMSLTVTPFADRRVELTARYEQTRDFFRLKFLSDARLKLGETKLDLTGKVDWRQRHDGPSSFGDSYVFGYSRAKWTVPVDASLNGTVQVQGEFVSFDSVTTTSVNYFRGGAKIGLEKLFEDFSFADVRLTFLAREVPDSTELSYITYGLEGTYFGIYDQGELDVFGRLERKDYNQTGGRNDYWRAEVDGRNKIRLGERQFTSQAVEFELTDYDPTDPVNVDYYVVEVTLLLGFEALDYSIGIGPELEALHEGKEDFTISEDYFEAGAKVDFDFMKLRRLFLSAESVTGHRDREDNNELLTDYYYERLNLIADATLFKGLALNVLFSTEWEWHSIATNDSRIYLLASNLTYSF
ncbi:MAG: hypothetical protein JSW34_06640 [Candidatus Zixiibacteriota bacterium]|nr:MAG: hypothetical protein JSW34_06640 [candidate division Zixibacteria bacterium]